MTIIPALVPPLAPENKWDRRLPRMAPFTWLGSGWRDLTTRPGPSLAYGLAVFLLSWLVVIGLFVLEWDYILFPALAGFMVVGPIFAIGLYEKSRRLAQGDPVTLSGMLLVRGRSSGQLFFVGTLLCLLMLLWTRAAVIVYALFFGLQPFPGLDHIVPMLVTTHLGWAMLVVGGLVGGLFAAFAFAISAVSIPMLLEERSDALTAMGTSMALVWNNLPVMLVWGAIVAGLTLVGLAPGMLGLIVVFPLLGHGTWHAYKAIRPPPPHEFIQAVRPGGRGP